MTAPVIPELPELPVFPSSRGEPDQPAAFFAKFFTFLDALRLWRAALSEFGAFVEENGGTDGGSDSGAAGYFIPLVDGSEPPNFISDGAGNLILVAGP